MKNKLHPYSISRPVDRRSFLKGSLLAGSAAVGAGLLTSGTLASAQAITKDPGPLSSGDVAILRFLAAAELIEADLWTQYAELGGIGANLPVEVDPNQTMNNYQVALSNLDGDGPQYITSNWKDELTHATFLNAYLESRGAEPVNFDEFETLPGSTATGSTGIGRLTNLMNLNVDTSWYVRYRSATNPDLGATFPQAITLNGVTAIPRTDADFERQIPPELSRQRANSGDRECSWLSLRIHRARRFESLRSPESKSDGSGSASDHSWHRWGRGRSLSGMG
jgi:hypothetical protein